MGTKYSLLRRPTHCLWGQYIYYIVGPPIAYWDNSFTRLSAHPLAMVTIYLLHSRPTHRLWGPYIVGPPILYDYNIYVGRRPLAHLRRNIVRVGRLVHILWTKSSDTLLVESAEIYAEPKRTVFLLNEEDQRSVGGSCWLIESGGKIVIYKRPECL